MTTDNELMKLYRDRLKDRRQSRTRRRQAVESGPKRVSDLLTLLFKQDDVSCRKIEEGQALSAWEKFVGDAASRFSKALRIRSHTLIVRVTDPLWMQQLSLLKHELLKKYRRGFPSLQIDDIFFTRQ